MAQWAALMAEGTREGERDGGEREEGDKLMNEHGG